MFNWNYLHLPSQRNSVSKFQICFHVWSPLSRKSPTPPSIFRLLSLRVMSFTVTLSSPISFSQTHHHRHRLRIHCFQSLPKSTIRFLSLKSPPFLLLPQASRRNSSNNTNLVDDPRNWSRSINNELLDDEDEEEEDDEDEEEDRSLDLLVRFVENVFKKVSKRARKAVRSVLPASISTKLVF